MRPTERTGRIAIRAFGITAVVFAWWLLGLAFPRTTFFISSPPEVAGALLSLIREHQFVTDITTSVFHAGIAFAIGAAVGVPIGVTIGRSMHLGTALELPVDFARSIPVSALFPAFVLWLGLGAMAQVAAAAFGSAMTFIINMFYGVRNRRRLREDYLRTLGATEWQVLWRVILPDSLPHLISAARIALSASLVLIVVTEMLGGSDVGIGRRIQDFRMSYRIPDMWASIVMIGFVGLLLNRILAWVEHRVVHWSGQ